ncbi:pentatricopeptide repeat-containing protein At1g11900 [Chenopodium quinoa]|uniref:pentatricopeptide repeat-containing protein At1g11900 n=1 Tax=Chenopodium quinoa TaxID=63459 RepID=UPI000B77118A|nr:pentatricopeptide repeat-containing protein At1g11900 [Chenopodium quinoa]
MLLISRTFRKSQITGTISFLLFSSIANSNVDGKSSLIIGGSHLHKTIGFGGKLSGRNIASVGTRMWPFFPILGSSRAPFRPFATNSSPDELGLTNDLLNHILCTLENTDICNRKICNGIERLCRSGNVSAITKLLQFSHEKHIFLAPDAYNILLAATSEWQDVELSLVIFKELLVSSKGMSSKSYFNLAKAFAITDDHSKLLNFVREISQLTSHCGALVLNRMIFAFAECRQIEKALKIYDHMKVLECKPDLVTYNTVIGLLGRAGLVDDMLREFASMKKAKIIPDIVTYNTLLNHLQKMGRLDLCLLYMREVDENGLIPDLRTYTALIESFGRSGNIEEALRLFSAMKSRQVRPSIYTYRSLICNLKKMGMLSAAASLLDEMNLSLTNLVGPKNFKRKNR